MKNSSKLMIVALIFVALSCKEKTTCTTCYISSDYPGATQSKNYCGTEYQISQEKKRLQNEAKTLETTYPGYSFTGNCN